MRWQEGTMKALHQRPLHDRILHESLVPFVRHDENEVG